MSVFAKHFALFVVVIVVPEATLAGSAVAKHDFDLLQLVEEAATSCAAEACGRQHALIGYMEPQLARMYSGDFNLIKEVLTSLTRVIMTLDSELDICIRATNGNVFEDDSVGVVAIRFAVHYTSSERPEHVQRAVDGIAELGGSMLRFGIEKGKGAFVSSVVRLSTSERQLDRPMFVDRLNGIPMFVLSNEPPPNRAIHGNLRYWGLRCDGAPTFQEGILEITRQACMDDPYRLVIVSQPIEDGSATDIAREIRSSSLSPITKLIHIDRYYNESSKRASIAAGFDAYFAKPFTTAELLQVISGQLNVNLMDADLLMTPNVLVVEDNLTNQKIATFQLRRLGITPDLATNGKEAVEALQRKNYGLVFMDLQMPIMDGLEATARIRSDPRFRNVPIIALTSNDDLESRKKCKDAGMNAHCTKPINPQVLESIIAEWCPAAFPKLRIA